jgi:hypothetical protein
MTYSGYEGIYIEPDDVPFSVTGIWTGAGYGGRFFTQCLQDLRTIMSRPIGKDLLDLIAKRHHGIGTKEGGRTITIKPQFSNLTKIGGVTGPAPGENENLKLRLGSYGDRLRLPGRGLSCTVRYAAFMTDGSDYQKAHHNSPSFITLAHELIHAWHYLSGTVEGEAVATKQGEARREEMLTTGLGPYANTRISENAIRAEHSLPRREYYTFEGDHMNIAPLGMDLRMLPPPQQQQGLCGWLWDVYMSIKTRI